MGWALEWSGHTQEVPVHMYLESWLVIWVILEEFACVIPAFFLSLHCLIRRKLGTRLFFSIAVLALNLLIVSALRFLKSDNQSGTCPVSVPGWPDSDCPFVWVWLLCGWIILALLVWRQRPLTKVKIQDKEELMSGYQSEFVLIQYLFVRTLMQ